MKKVFKKNKKKQECIDDMLNNPNNFYKNTKRISDTIRIEKQKEEFLSRMFRNDLDEDPNQFDKYMVVFLAATEIKKQEK